MTIEPSFSSRTPDGDNRPREVCDHCDFIHYTNPKVIVGIVATWEERLLLCRRSIEPRSGFWTIPAGFMEVDESTQEGALREAHEEAGARATIDTLLAIYSIPRISQVQIIYRATLDDPDVVAGEESLEVELFEWSKIPWDDLAFPSVRWALQHHREVEGKAHFVPFHNPEGETGDFSEMGL